MKKEAETGVVHLQAKQCQRSPEARGEEWNRLLHNPQKEPSLPTSLSWTSSHQNCKTDGGKVLLCDSLSDIWGFAKFKLIYQLKWTFLASKKTGLHFTTTRS